MKAYKDKAKSIIAAAMPKNIDLGNAAISVVIDAEGSVCSVGIINSSPSKQVDDLILRAVQNLRFGRWSSEFREYAMRYGTLPVYFECGEAAGHLE